MSGPLTEKDLIVLVADPNMEAAVKGVLRQHQKLGIRSIATDVRRHPRHDPRCRTKGVNFLSAFTEQYAHAILMFDYEGCGVEADTASELESKLTAALGESGWGDRAATVILVPELEIWVWSDSPRVDEALGWKGRDPKLREWLMAQNYLVAGQAKPIRPKEAMEAALKIVRKPRSSAIFAELASQVGFERCVDQSFVQLKTTLRNWFPAV
jgi:hypothetical protein